LISVPQPLPRDNGKTVYDLLPEAEVETQAIVEAMTAHGVRPQVLVGSKATWDNVYEAVKGGGYHIVHFNGHAYFNATNPRMSSLVLFDQDFSTGQVRTLFSSAPPVFFFMNACETAATGVADWKRRYDIYGLARAILETSSYLIGTRWKVGDKGAGAFAKAFYSGLLSGRSLGFSIRDGRAACQQALPADDLSWASYLFYGDPRICFKQETVAPRLHPPPDTGGEGG
jgi:CHAT domain-containing protein